MAKSFTDQMAKVFHICKRISFAISTFVIITRNNLADRLVKREEMKKVDPFKRIAVHTALQQTHTVFSLLPEN